MFVEWMSALGAWLVFVAASLQAAETMKKPWAWLTVARERDRANYEKATSASVTRRPFAWAISGITDKSAIWWVPTSVELESYKSGVWGWFILMIGSSWSAAASSLGAMGKMTLASIKTPVSAIPIAIVPIVLLCCVAFVADRLRQEEVIRASEEFEKNHPRESTCE